MRTRPFVLTTIALASLAAACDSRRDSEGVATTMDTSAMAPAPPVAEGSYTSAAPGLLRGSAASAGRKEVATTFAADRPGTLPQGNAVNIASSSMIIRTGMAAVEVDSIDRAVDLIRSLAIRLGGYVADVNVQGGRDQLRSATIQLRIPSARFDDAVAGLTPLGKVESVNVTAQDVGEEYVDVSARAANARRLEERLVALLAARTGRLQDVLEVERELARVREEIERYEGRMRYLSARAAVSSLAITVHERTPVVAGYRTTRVLADAFGEAWRNFIGFVAGFIALLGVLVPLLAIGGVIAIVIARLIRRAPAGSLRGAPALRESPTET